MEVPMTMHSDHHTDHAASDGTREALWMGGVLLVAAIIAIWYFAL
jgi:hypothetical protein